MPSITDRGRRAHPRGRRGAQRIALGGALLAAATSSAALAGLGGGGGGTHSWTGGVNTSWHDSGNWNTNQVPAAGDAAIVLGGMNNVLLFADTAPVRSLFVGGARAIYNNGHVLNVTSGDGVTTVTGPSSMLFITPAGTPFALLTDTLSIEAGADLHLDGGRVLVNDQLDMLSGGSIAGHGYIDVDSPSPGAFNGVDAGELTVYDGDLHIRMFSGGSMALPGTIDITEPGHDLLLTGAVLTPVQDVNLGAASLIVGEPWTLDGLLTANTGGDGLARVAGDGTMSVEGQISLASGTHLRLEGVARFKDTSSTWIGPNATLEIDDWYDADPGHATTIGMNGRLLIGALHYSGGWQGDITSQAGTIEVNGPAAMQVSGTIHLGSLFGLRSHVAGTADLRAIGNVNAPGLGAIVDGTLDIRPTSTMTLGPSAQIITNGELLLRAGSDVEGSGQLTVNEGGTLVIEETADVNANVVNGGVLRAGEFSNEHYVYIDGTYEQTASGSLQVQIGGPSNVDRDIYETNGSADLAGELVVELTDGFAPEIGDAFEIMWTNGGVSGSFDAVTGEPGFAVSYSANIVTITYEGVNGCPADVSGDGMVDVDDLVAVILAWGVCEGCAEDIDQSGAVDVDDLLQVILGWGACE